MKTSLCRGVAAGLILGTLAPVTGSAALVLNPSFEKNYNETWPHYGGIDDWQGGSGVNDATGPFHNGGTPIPDLGRAAFSQGSRGLSQVLSGLTPGRQYFAQFLYDARNCCGGTVDILVKWEGNQLGEKIPNVRAATGGAPYQGASFTFVPEADTGTLTLETVVNGDATGLFDGVTVVARDKDPDATDVSRQHLAVLNPSFEASGAIDDTVVFDGAGIAGWAREGTVSVATAGTTSVFDNGAPPDQDNVAVLSGPSSLSQTVQGIRVGSKVEITVAYNAKTGSTPHIQVKAGDTVLFEEDVTAVGGTNPFKKKTVSFSGTEVNQPISIVQTKDGETLFVDDVSVVAGVGEVLKPIEFSTSGLELGPSQKATLTATVDPAAIRNRSITLQLRSPNAAIARLTGANDDGLVSLTFAQGGEVTKSFEVEALARGVVRLEVVDAGGLKIKDDVTVSVVTSFVRNSSFESNGRAPGVGYGAIAAWTGGSGLNKSDGPFHDNGIVPDRDQVAFVQGSSKLSQPLFGLSVGQTHWLQFRYNARAAGETTIDLEVKVGGKTLTTFPNVAAVGPDTPYRFASLEFVPEAANGELEFVTTAHGDATLLLDAVSIVVRPKDPAHPDIVIENPSFEADGSPEGVGYLQPRKVAGWELAGGYGVNLDGVGPFTDNGRANSQDRVLFLQGNGSASQFVSGLVPGEKYTLTFAVNSRNCCTAGPTKVTVSLDDLVLADGVEVSPVGQANPFTRQYLTFTAGGTEGTLRIQHVVEAGDHSLLLDDIRLQKGEIVAPPPALPALAFANPTEPGGWILRWNAAEAVGATLESATSIRGPWSADPAPISNDGTFDYIVPTFADPQRYYRLVR